MMIDPLTLFSTHNQTMHLNSAIYGDPLAFSTTCFTGKPTILRDNRPVIVVDQSYFTLSKRNFNHYTAPELGDFPMFPDVTPVPPPLVLAPPLRLPAGEAP